MTRRYKIRIRERRCERCREEPATATVYAQRQLADGTWKHARTAYDLCPACARALVARWKLRDRLQAAKGAAP